nr:hypothetical protein [uncultured Mediterranean phage uvMED]
MALNFANNNSLSAITAKPSGLSGGTLNLISTQTASSSSTISFTSGIDDTYDEYVFKFYNIHPATDSADFTINFSVDGGSNYNVTKTTTLFRAIHSEADDVATLGYIAADDLAQSTGELIILDRVKNDNDMSGNGTFQLFSPSSTTFVKHFISRTAAQSGGDYQADLFIAGYGNTTSAINAVRFKFHTGNIDSGVIKLYGVS